jgi:hypothetical protein
VDESTLEGWIEVAHRLFIKVDDATRVRCTNDCCNFVVQFRKTAFRKLVVQFNSGAVAIQVRFLVSAILALISSYVVPLK